MCFRFDAKGSLDAITVETATMRRYVFNVLARHSVTTAPLASTACGVSY